MAGPQENRLRAAVGGASRWDLFLSEWEWQAGAKRLEQVAKALRDAAPVMEEDFGGQTGMTARDAFILVADRSQRRSDEMHRVGEAVAQARNALVEAEAVDQDLAQNPPGEQPTRPTTTPGTHDVEDIKRQRAYTTQLNAYQAAAAEREERARAAADRMDQVYADSTATMKQVHGEPDREADSPGGPGPSGDAGATGVVGAGGRSAGGGAPPEGTVATSAGDPHQTWHQTQVHHQADAPTTPSLVAQSEVVAPGTSQGPNQVPGTTAPAPAAGPAGSSSPGTHSLGGLAGAVGGGLIGGAAGIGGAVRGGAATVPAGSATSQARTIGSSSRAGTSGALGRGTTTAGSPTSRPVPVARAGAAGSAPRSAGTAGAARTAIAAGGRGAVGPGGRHQAAATAAGRAGTGKDKERAPRVELFESEQDWVDDEGAAPGVIG